MDYASLVPYFIASAIFLVAPGPLMAVLIARALGHGIAGGLAFAAGLCLGCAAVTAAVALGIGFWAEGQPELLSLAKYVGVSYLLWLAFGMWNDRSGVTSAPKQKQGWVAAAVAGIVLCIGNPSILLFYMLLFPSVAPAGPASLDYVAIVVLVTFASAAIVFVGTALLAGQLNRLISSNGASGRFARLSAAATALTAVWILAA